MQINQLNQAASLSLGDLIAIFSTNNGDAQNASLSMLADFISEQINSTSSGLVTQYASPNASGFSIQLGSVPKTWLLLTPLAGYAAGTLVLPPSPTDQNEINVTTTQSVTALTITPPAGTVVNGAPTTLAANAQFSLRYDGVSKNWYCFA